MYDMHILKKASNKHQEKKSHVIDMLSLTLSTILEYFNVSGSGDISLVLGEVLGLVASAL